MDARVVEDYETREKNIESLLKQFEKKKHKLEKQRQNYDDLKKGWIDQVEEMINVTALFVVVDVLKNE